MQKMAKGDGDTWIEVPITMPTRRNKQKHTRSLFYSVKTQAGVWDEPPTGASKIIFREDIIPAETDSRGPTRW